MKVMVDVGVVPIGVGVSLSSYVAACERVFAEAGLTTRLHAYGTNIEGGVYRSGPHELIISSPELQGAAGGDTDLLVVDETSGWSSTLARLSVPRWN